MTTLEALDLAIKALQAVFRMGEFFQSIIPGNVQWELLDFAANRAQLAILRLERLQTRIIENQWVVDDVVGERPG